MEVRPSARHVDDQEVVEGQPLVMEQVEAELEDLGRGIHREGLLQHFYTAVEAEDIDVVGALG